MEKSEKRSLAVYLVTTFAAAWVLQIIACAVRQPVVQGGLLLAVMAVPTLGVLAAKGGLAGLGWRPRVKRNWKSFLTALLLPPALTALGAALYFLLFPKEFSLEFPYVVSILATSGAAQEIPPATVVLVSVLQSITYAPFINMLPALGEEIGWRGYMAPQFQKILGDKPGLIAAGIVWGLWHAPLIVLIGYEYGTGYFGAPVSGVLLFCVFGAAAGTICSRLYEKSQTIWVPALAHGAVNAAGGVPLMFCSSVPTEYFLGPVACGLISGIPFMVAGLVLLARRAR